MTKTIRIVLPNKILKDLSMIAEIENLKVPKAIEMLLETKWLREENKFDYNRS